ncbi:MAG: outer membrane beta-barrel domain-containing protein [Myxococcota bacterium]
MSLSLPRFILAGAMLLASVVSSTATAQETVDIGALRNDEINVVQNVLFPKDGRLELGGHLGWMPFDPLVTTPQAQFSIDKHFSESIALSVLIGGGYGLKTGRYVELEGPSYGLAPAAYRYLASALVGVSWSPIYAKMALGPAKVVHFDIYGTARGGATLEQSVIPNGGFTVAPTVSLGAGMRFFASEKLVVRVEMRDDLLVEYRPITSTWHFKQNGGLTLGFTSFLGRGNRR